MKLTTTKRKAECWDLLKAEFERMLEAGKQNDSNYLSLKELGAIPTSRK
jgi:hypothetical protein